MSIRGSNMYRREPSVSMAWMGFAAVAAACVLLTGCSGSGDPAARPSEDPSTPEASASATPTPTPEATPPTFEQAETAYHECLGENGSEPGLVPSGVDLSEVAEMTGATDEELLAHGTTREAVVAHAACWPAFLAAVEAGATPPPSAAVEGEGEAAVDPELAAKMHDAVACLNERGWDFLEPGVETGAVTMEARAAGFNWHDEAFLTDQRECQQLAGMMG